MNKSFADFFVFPRLSRHEAETGHRVTKAERFARAKSAYLIPSLPRHSCRPRGHRVRLCPVAWVTKTCLTDLLTARTISMKVTPLLLVYAVLLAVISPSQAVASDKSIGLNTTELRSALMGKTKSEVKAFFGRNPDEARGTSLWGYNVSAMDPDSEKLNVACVVSFQEDNVYTVQFR